MKTLVYIIPALALSFFSGPLAIFFAKKMGAIDVPESATHKKHNTPTPLAGGVVLLFVFPILILLSSLGKEPLFVALFVGCGIIFFFGIFDDIYGLSAHKKFFGQFCAAGIVAYSGTTIRFLETVNLPFETPIITILNWGLTLFWIVGITNAFNLIDSMDGLVAGLTFIIASFFTFIVFIAGQILLAKLSAILIGISLGLYFYNKPPARFFLGDSGAQVIGFLLAAIAIMYRPPDLNPGSTWFVPVLLLGVPIFDTSLVIISRLRRRKPLFQADRAHTYHRLVQKGFNSKQAVFLIHSSALSLSFLALLAMFLPPKYAIVLFFLVLFLGCILIFFFETFIKLEE
ncbi:MAG: undecaprenyl/decaprenyl-phosphate alpha-N-acetylglucosaminyl 1-phosphate transferase [Chloroflexi bacterium]|nr:undecaprenyl/decaprenyl-phosphate alpha-N-acetylglucosaminyl 1-phosphate transferase [Chloroflexota bacterium]